MGDFEIEVEEDYTQAQKVNIQNCGILEYFVHKDALERLLIKKVSSGNQLGIMDENTFRKVIDRVNTDDSQNLFFQMVHSTIKRESTINLCGPNNVVAEFYFDSGKFSLKNLLERQIQYGAIFQYSFLCEVLSF